MPKFAHFRRVAAALAAIALVMALPVAAALDSHSSTPETGYLGHGNDSLSVSVADGFTFTPSLMEAAAPGDNVSLTVTQLGSTVHTFTLASTANYSFPTGGTPDFTTYFAQYPPLVNINITGTTGFTTTVHFIAPPLGVYEYVCTQSGHFSQGMLGFFGSGVAPSGPAGPGPPTGVYIIAGVVVSLVVIALVLGFVVGKREGSKYEMPPERLGYPEPKSPGTPPH